MFCRNCGTKMEENEKFCRNCGTKRQENSIDENSTLMPVEPIKINPELIENKDNINNKPKKKKKKLWPLLLIFPVIIILAVLGIVALMLILGPKFKKEDEFKKERTIMIYMVGSDLESENSLASYDIKDIVSENIDLENNNILLMVGGSPKWHNFVDEDEIAIYELQEEGFEKIESYKLNSMGKTSTFSNFLNYSYENYKANKYDLIFWNHGLGVAGVGLDEVSDDYLTISEFSSALDKSPFDEKNKLESIIFVTCLTGNLQFANVVKDHAEYMIASEEVSYAARDLNKLNFLEEIEVEDTGLEVGEKFVKNFSKSVNRWNRRYNSNLDSTYSVIDLSQISQLQKDLDTFINDSNVKNNYRKIAIARGNINQYGNETLDFDTVDLYELVTSLRSLSPKKADKVLSDIEKAVVYNWSLNDYSNGLAVYFPYKATDDVIDIQLAYLSKVDDSKYYDFIVDFNDTRKNPKKLSYSLTNSISNATENDFELQLTEEQVENFSRASFTVFRDMGDGYYMPMYQSSETNVSESGLLTAKFSGNALKVIDTDDNSSETILLIDEGAKNNIKNYSTLVILDRFDEDKGLELTNANMYLTVDENNNINISKIVKIKESVPSNTLVELKDYQDLFFANYKYKILDDAGNYTEDWEGAGTAYLFRTGTDLEDYIFEISNLDDGYNYYCIFKVYDIYNNYHYSGLIPMK